MDESKRDGAWQGEDITLPELGELLGDYSRVEQLLELDPELRVDHGHQEAPDGQTGKDGEELDPLEPPRLKEQRGVHRSTTLGAVASSLEVSATCRVERPQSARPNSSA